MAQFDIKLFLNTPGVEQLDLCHSDDLLEIGAHFGVPVSRHMLKKDVKRLLVEQGILLKMADTTEQKPEPATPGARVKRIFLSRQQHCHGLTRCPRYLLAREMKFGGGCV